MSRSPRGRSPSRAARGTPRASRSRADVEGDEIVLRGKKAYVEAAGVADHGFLVTGAGTGRRSDGLTQVLVPAGTDGVTVTPGRSIDITRRYGSIDFDGARAPAVGGGRRGRRRGRRGRAPARDRARPAVRRDGRRRRPRVRVHHRVRTGPVRVRPADRVVPGAQAPHRRHAPVARVLEGDRRRRGAARSTAGITTPPASRASPRPTSATGASTSSTTACRSTVASA